MEEALSSEIRRASAVQSPLSPRAGGSGGVGSTRADMMDEELVKRLALRGGVGSTFVGNKMDEELVKRLELRGGVDRDAHDQDQDCTIVSVVAPPLIVSPVEGGPPH